MEPNADQQIPEDLEEVCVLGSRLLAIRNDRITNKLKAEGRHEWADTSIVPMFLTDGASVVDVGANIGYYTGLFSLMVGSRGTVHAFEAHPRTAAILKMNVERNNWANVRFNACAVSDQAGEIRVRAGDLDFHGRRETDETNAGGWKLVPREDGTVAIPAVTLDEYIQSESARRPSFVKIDVEGFEQYVLAGARQLLKHQTTVFMVEFMAQSEADHTACQSVVKILDEVDYTLATIRKKPVPHLVPAGDLIASPPYHANLFALPPSHRVILAR